MRWLLTLLASVCGFLVVSAVSTIAASVPASPGTHFIVLIDDSGDMGGHQRNNRFVPALSRVLFEGASDIPTVDVHRGDWLSVAFFALPHPEKGLVSSCKPKSGYDLSSEFLFDYWQPLSPSDMGKERFLAALSKQLDKPCRFKEGLSPIATSQHLILPFIGQKLEDEHTAPSFFSRIMIVTVTNAAFNTIPSTEIPYLASKHKIQHTEEAQRLTNKVDQYFTVKTRESWLITVPNNFPNSKSAELFVGYGYTGDGPTANPLRLQVAEVHPVGDAEGLLDLPKEVMLDRVAVAADQLNLRLTNGELAHLRLLPSERFVPQMAHWLLSDEKGGPWRVGSQKLAEATRLPLSPCEKPCAAHADGLHISLLEALGAEPFLRPDDSLLRGAIVRVKVGFRYHTKGLYERYALETVWRDSRITPVSPLVVEEGRLLDLPIDAFLLPRQVLDNATLAGLWTPRDSTGLKQDAARGRLLAQRDGRWLRLLGSFALGLVGVMALCYVTAFHRPFTPRLEWHPSQNVSVNFNHTTGAKILVGTVVLLNDGQPGWFGKLLRNKTQPERSAKLRLHYKSLQEEYGFHLRADEVPLGFLEVESDSDTVVREITQTVSHETAIHVFLARDLIEDFVSEDGKIESTERTLPLQITMDWRTRRWDTGRREALRVEAPLAIHVVPEDAAPPHITFQLGTEPCEFQGGNQVVGTFTFHSPTSRHFALSYSKPYEIRAYRDNLPLPDGAIALARTSISIAPASPPVVVPVYVSCDGEVVPNPEPPNQRYTFRLVGDYAPGSASGPHAFDLWRDRTKANVELTIRQGHRAHEIFWDDSGQARHRVRAGDEGASVPVVLEGARFTLEPREVRFRDGSPPTDVLTIEVGNRARHGRGVVQVQMAVQAAFTPGVQSSLRLQSGARLEALTVVLDDNVQPQRGAFEVREGWPTAIRKVCVDTRIIDTLSGGRLSEHDLGVRTSLQITIVPEGEEPIQRVLELFVPVALEKAPPRNWLGIDFGNSAIAAAVGAGRDVKLLNLQRIVEDGDPQVRLGRNFADYDQNNIEVNTYFLPSQVVCDPDCRIQENTNVHAKPGHPLFWPTSRRPGDAAFLGLPATGRQRDDMPRRIIYSLKSWLGKSAAAILIDDAVEYQDEDGTISRKSWFPLEATVQSGFAALVEAYLLDQRLQAGQVVVCHPNTFTPFHQDHLHRIVCNAVMERLQIPLATRIHLMSESDAVAYYYCMQRMTGPPPRGVERLLVYDLGSGTLDLSIIKIEWQESARAPKTWAVESRLGVPVAGNYLDEVLARFVHDILAQQDGILNREHFDYRFPIVASRFRNGQQQDQEHAEAIHNLWMAIRTAKQQRSQDGSAAEEEPLHLVIGSLRSSDNTVVGARAIDTASFDPYKQPPDPHHVGLWYRPEKDELYLCVPLGQLHASRGMQEALNFMIKDVIDEALFAAGPTPKEGLKPEDITTILVSGRGALWPGLRQRIWQQFPGAERPDFVGQGQGNLMKEAVVRGAIAWQTLRAQAITFAKPPPPRLAIVLEDTDELKPQEEWGTPIRLDADATFRLVQVAHQRPKYQQDKQSLRRHFYIDVDAERFDRDIHWDKDPYLFVTPPREVDGRLIISLTNRQGHGIDIATGGSGTHNETVRPAWPIGQVLLEPIP